MSRRLRIILAILLSILGLVGAGLAFVSRPDPFVIPYNTQKTVCNFQYAIEVNPFQSLKNNCAVLQNDWLQLDLKSSLNLTLSITLLEVGGGRVTLFSDTASQFNASFPITENGALLTVLSSHVDNVSSVNGTLAIYASSLTSTTALKVTYPYRTGGEALAGIAAFGLFLVVWNPSPPGAARNLIVPRRPEQSEA